MKEIKEIKEMNERKTDWELLNNFRKWQRKL